MEDHISFSELMDWILFKLTPAATIPAHIAYCQECAEQFRLVQVMAALCEGTEMPSWSEYEVRPTRERTV